MSVPAFDDLPQEIDCLILPDTILLPKGHIPVTVTEPHMIQVVDQALATNRLLGIVQPQQNSLFGKEIFAYGTLGKITTFIEREPQHYFILLSGLTRFEVCQEIHLSRKHRRLKVNYHPFALDMVEQNLAKQTRFKLIDMLKGYLSLHQIKANFEDFDRASDDDLINSLTLLCPFDTQEKQALLESTTTQDRFEMMTLLMEMAVMRTTNLNLTLH